MQDQKKTNKSSASTMEQLLASYKSPFVSIKKGDNIKGVITKLTPKEILVNINAKSEAVVLEKDKSILRNLLANLKVGDEVSVFVLDPESDRGQPVVSLRRFIDDILWKRLQDIKEKKQEIEVLVTESTKGGFVVQTDFGFLGFLPNSYITSSVLPNEVVNKKIKAFVLELNREEKKIILSQKAVLSTKDFEDIIKSLKVEQKIDTVVSNITPFGLFVSLQTPEGKKIDGLIHISEISWDKVEDLSNFAQGQKVEAVIIGLDKDAKRVDLSIKRLSRDPFEEIIKKFAVDQKVKAKVIKAVPAGLMLEISDLKDAKAEGFIRKEKIPPTVAYEAGDRIEATISEIDSKRHRIILVPVLREKPIGYR